MIGKHIAKRLRLFPAVIALGTILLAVKGFGLAFDAHAQTPSAQPTAAAQESNAAKPDLAADDKESTSAEVDVLASLSKRRAALDGREHELETREILLQAAEKRVDDKIASLKDLQSQIQALLSQRDDAAQKQLDALTKSYSSMKPRDAARIFNSLNDDVLLGVAAQMKPDVLGAILAQMQIEPAQKLTLKLANRTKLPDAPPPNAQIAMAPAPAPSAAAPTQLPPPITATPAPAAAIAPDKATPPANSAAAAGATPAPEK